MRMSMVVRLGATGSLGAAMRPGHERETTASSRPTDVKTTVSMHSDTRSPARALTDQAITGTRGEMVISAVKPAAR